MIAQRFRAGFGANHNAVIRASTGRYVYVLNEDTISEPGSIDRMVEYMDANPKVGMVGPKIILPDRRQQASAWRLTTIPVALAWALSADQVGVVLSKGGRPKEWERCPEPPMLLLGNRSRR